jgi:hypothetical protein
LTILTISAVSPSCSPLPHLNSSPLTASALREQSLMSLEALVITDLVLRTIHARPHAPMQCGPQNPCSDDQATRTLWELTFHPISSTSGNTQGVLFAFIREVPNLARWLLESFSPPGIGAVPWLSPLQAQPIAALPVSRALVSRCNRRFVVAI